MVYLACDQRVSDEVAVVQQRPEKDTSGGWPTPQNCAGRPEDARQHEFRLAADFAARYTARGRSAHPG